MKQIPENKKEVERLAAFAAPVKEQSKKKSRLASSQSKDALERKKTLAKGKEGLSGKDNMKE